MRTTKTLLHRTLGDENILIVKFEEQARGASPMISGDHNAFYGKVAKEGILIGQRCFHFFGNISKLPRYYVFIYTFTPIKLLIMHMYIFC